MSRLKTLPVIGVDLDNTIIDYDDVMRDLAQKKGLIPKGLSGKKQIRDAIRLLPEGQIEWQKLQALAYGRNIEQARLIDGVTEFFKRCRAEKIPTFIVSHKTEYATSDDTRTNLRESALKWMRSRGFFDVKGLGLRVEDVFFESTRLEKVSRIRDLGCSHFIDDLEETFLEENFPRSIVKVLYAPHEARTSLSEVRHTKSWGEIAHFFFN